jgi:rhodanese-related sulfurtransferase
VKVLFVRQAAILAALAFLPAIAQTIYFRGKISWQTPDLPSEVVKIDQARSWGANAIWVDARPDNEFEQDHVPGALLLNEDRWDELLPVFLAQWSQLPVPNESKHVIVYCSTESCNLAREVADRLRKSTQPPMQNVFVLDGGWEEWLKTKR